MLEITALVWSLADAESPGELRSTAPSFVVAYHPAPGCPTQASFEAAILARAPNSRSEPQTAEVRFEAELAPAPGQKPRLRATLDDGSSQDREIDADDCDEAVQSMAVIAAMILSSRATHEAKAAPAPTPVPAPAHTQPVVADSTPSVPRTRRTRLAVGAGLGLEGAAAPGPTFAASAFVELGSVTGNLLAPSLRATALFGRAARVTTPVGDASFSLALGRLHACALRLGRVGASVRVCAVVEGGAVFACGIDARNERDQTMKWFGAGLGAIGGLNLSKRWELDLSASARGLGVRDKFVFAPSTQIHQVPVIAWDFSLTLGCRLW
jgi:hypothetical protein